MLKLVLTLSLAFAIAITVVAQASHVTLAGVVTKVDRGQIEVRTDSRKTIAISLRSDTRYLKWIMTKPWQQDVRSEARALRAGSRVHVELDGEAATLPSARTVWIVLAKPGF